jgi:hypothetical protein
VRGISVQFSCSEKKVPTGFLYGENAGELKNKAFSGFGGGSEGENCKNAIETGLWDRYIRMIVPKES